MKTWHNYFLCGAIAALVAIRTPLYISEGEYWRAVGLLIGATLLVLALMHRIYEVKRFADHGIIWPTHKEPVFWYLASSYALISAFRCIQNGDLIMAAVLFFAFGLGVYLILHLRKQLLQSYGKAKE